MALAVNNLPANAGAIRDLGSIPGSGRSPEGGHGSHSSILAWKIPWTEELDRLQSIELRRVAQSQRGVKRLSVHALFPINK